jgi:hypothetical protein
MGLYRETQGLGPEMGDLAKEIHRTFGVIVLQRSISRTHSAHRFYLTGDAFRSPGDLLLSNLQQKLFPSLLKTAFSKIESIGRG